jgi:UDP-glucose 4-epimerase
MTTHLILGGCGFIGRHVAISLARRGEQVILAGRSPLAIALPGVSSNDVSFRYLDLSTVHWDALLEGSDVIHHYAWSTIPQTANEDPIGDLDTNVRSSLGLLEAMRRRRGGRLIFASSGGTVYGVLRRTPVSEDHPLKPITVYGASKVAVEAYLGVYRALYGIDCRVARLSNPFGAGQDPRRNQGAASVFLHKSLAGEKIAIWGDGKVVRDYIHISDVVSGLISLVDAALDCHSDLPIFNIANGEGVDLNRIVAILSARLGRKLDVAYEPGRPFDIPVSVLDISRARNFLGWAPRLSFEQGMALSIRDILSGSQAYSTL